VPPNHISSSSSPKITYLDTVVNGSKVASQESGQVLLSPLNLNFVLHIPHYPYNLILLSQLTHLLKCSLTFDVNPFVIKEHSTSCLIEEDMNHKVSMT